MSIAQNGNVNVMGMVNDSNISGGVKML